MNLYDSYTLLSVAVPTYNRPEKLARLARSFLIPASGMEGVEVLVCDNSDTAIAEKNQAMFAGTPIRYRKNEINLGFHGNIVRCIEQATGKWLWIISDDDEVDIQAFDAFLAALRDGLGAGARAVMFPYWVTGMALDGTERRFLTNTMETWGGDGTLRELVVRAGRVPFILFSSAVVRRDAERVKGISALATRHAPNDYMQVICFAHLIGWDGRIAFWHQPLQVYRHALEGRFPLRGMAESMDRLLGWMAEDAGLDARAVERMRRGLWNGWAIWYARHRAGEVRIQQVEEAFGFLLQGLARHRLLKGLALVLGARYFPSALFVRMWKRLPI